MSEQPVSASQRAEDTWELGGHRFRSRLIVGTGRMRSLTDSPAGTQQFYCVRWW